MAKLTLNVDSRVISRAKLTAKRQDVTVSEMVETYLDAVGSALAPAAEKVPSLTSLRGALKTADLDEYRIYIAAKYR